MISFKMYDVVEVQHPTHPRNGTRGVIGGMLAADGEIMGYSVRFADDMEMVDPDDLEYTGLSITEQDFDHGPWPPAVLSKDSSAT